MVETGIPTSFIPHETAAPASVRRRDGGGLNELLLLCAIVLFVASAALAVGVFLYGQFLAAESASKLEQLERAKAAFQPALIQQLTRLDDRMHAADRVLGSHIAPSQFFRALEQATLQTVSFQTLDFQVPDSQHLSIKMAGTAQSVNSIALQADLFSKNGVITSPVFSNIARLADGVHFNLAAVVNPAAINYSALVNGALSAGDTESEVPAQGAPSTGSQFGERQNETSASSTSQTPPTQTPPVQAPASQD